MEKEKFLGDTEVDAGTGVAVARVVTDFLLAWGLTPKTPGANAVAFSIDTCTVNMGRDSGENHFLQFFHAFARQQCIQPCYYSNHQEHASTLREMR